MPIEGLEIGGSFMAGKYDADELYHANYYFAHLRYGVEPLTIAAEFGQMEVDVDPANMQTAANANNGTTGDSPVTQRSWYASAGYRILYKQARTY